MFWPNPHCFLEEVLKIDGVFKKKFYDCVYEFSTLRVSHLNYKFDSRKDNTPRCQDQMDFF